MTEQRRQSKYLKKGRNSPEQTVSNLLPNANTYTETYKIQEAPIQRDFLSVCLISGL